MNPIIITLLIVIPFSIVYILNNKKDFWRTDKKKHLIVSSIISLVIYCIYFLYSNELIESFLLSLIITLFIGIIKESYDSRYKNHTEDINDVYADLIGAISGSYLGLLLGVIYDYI